MLTAALVKAAAPRARAYKIGDGRGLHLHVAPTGTRSFRMKFRYDGREKLLTFGCFPKVSLADARARCDAAHEQLARGAYPSRRHASDADAKTDTVESVARAWHAVRLPRWSPVHGVEVLASLERDVFPAIGAALIGAIDAPAVLELLQAIERRGAIETARRVRQRISAFYRFAIARKLVTADPAAIVADELAPAPLRRRQLAIEDLGAARALLDAAERADAPAIVKLASRFLALTAVRLAAVRGARWEELEGLDGPEALWRVPAARMKLAAAKKRDAANDHVVPLSRQAVDVLRVVAKMRNCANSKTGLIFPGRAGAIGEAAIGALYARAGFAGRHVPHGWRATFSTILNERFPEDRDAIDRALAHAPKDKVEAAYNRAAHLGRRRDLFQRWADLLID